MSAIDRFAATRPLVVVNKSGQEVMVIIFLDGDRAVFRVELAPPRDPDEDCFGSMLLPDLELAPLDFIGEPFDVELTSSLDGATIERSVHDVDGVDVEVILASAETLLN